MWHPVHPCIRKGMAATCRWTGCLLSRTAPGPTLTAYCGVWLTSIAAGPGALLLPSQPAEERGKHVSAPAPGGDRARDDVGLHAAAVLTGEDHIAGLLHGCLERAWMWTIRSFGCDILRGRFRFGVAWLRVKPEAIASPLFSVPGTRWKGVSSLAATQCPHFR